jgi:hypothetical protein
MTDTLERSARVDAWLSAFEDALAARDIDRAAGDWCGWWPRTVPTGRGRS